ncbi:50S ribosomal protein L24 [Luteimonas sp. SJ-92]|uniref:Large ribosomal subunit protein uL24 n=1 Tax=Luteimonas salinisoli TaxID=2752307 RepID=A0A853JFN9_9GAMM|nr:50S ribosomal protein L24 [Luteimonas salinisoli]
MNRIKKGDQVIVTAGKDKGKKGDVVRVLGDKVVVSNINIVKRHTKPNPQANQPGGVIEREAPIHVSNVMPFNPASGKGERIGTKVLEDGRRIRVFRSSGEAVDA